ncbi:hypothetical protein [Blackfly microvirus SF02]|uniref:Uncharacterized protein n=1 Tax=Blackfly microvirus SF02 TaxID=2576452 RepID=A0A4P8PJV3_9VIRU|nr:hypothetical protein [Blackfly microvirus SF02]
MSKSVELSVPKFQSRYTVLYPELSSELYPVVEVSPDMGFSTLALARNLSQQPKPASSLLFYDEDFVTPTSND